MKKISLILLISWIAFCHAQNVTPVLQVSSDSLMKHTDFFSLPDKMGRLPGTEGFNKSADYAITLFKNYKIEPLPGFEQFRQYVPLESNLIHGPCEFHVIHYNKGIVESVHGENYSFRGFTGNGKITTETVFCGYGISEEWYDDYADIDVREKTVLIFKGEPTFDSGKQYKPFSIRSRAQTAREHGAAAVIFIPVPGSERSKPIGSIMCGEGEYIPDMPLLQIDFETCDLLFDGTGLTTDELYREIRTKNQPASKHLPSKISINISSEYKPEIKSYNVLGQITGTDPVLENEYILMTAHLDHVGFQCDVIYPGANDNASGSAAVIELARLFSLQKPLRSVVFVLFTAEESGLEGAEFMASHLPIPAEQIVAVMNFDCIAVGDSIQIGNGISCPELYRICKGFDHNSLMVSQTWKGGGADLTPFSRLGIPGLYFVSKYSYTHLHLPSDSISTLNPEIFTRLVQLGYETARYVSDGKYAREEIIE